MPTDPILRRLADAAAPRSGLIDRAGLWALNISYSHERSLVARAALTEATPGIFLVGGQHVLSHVQLLHLGLLAAGWGARLASASALEIHGALAARPAEVHVTRVRPTPQPRERLTTLLPVDEIGRPAAIVIDTPRTPRAGEIVRAWPVEPVARGLRQLAADEDTRGLLRKAWREADYLGLITESAVRLELERGRPGSRHLRALLREQPPRNRNDEFRSRAEYLLLEALLDLGVPRPRVNALLWLDGLVAELDLYFPEAGLVVEVDGPQHDLPTRRVEDEARDEALRAHGIETMRFPDEVVRDAAAECALQVRARRAARLKAHIAA